MKTIAPLLVLAAAAALPGAAHAGCWATVSLRPAPSGLQAGDVWRVAITVKQHRNKLLAGAKPRVTIRGDGGTQIVFRAKATPRKGVYRANVVFPTAGSWTYTVNDGFLPYCARDHAFAAVTVAEG